jgi:Excinuclease ATPase subunit
VQAAVHILRIVFTRCGTEGRHIRKAHAAVAQIAHQNFLARKVSGNGRGHNVMPKEPTARRKARLLEVLCHRQPDLTLVLANIHDPHNVSAIYRSCDAFGVSRVHLYYTNTPFPVLGRKTSASARKWVESVRHKTSEDMGLSLNTGALLPWATNKMFSRYEDSLKALGKRFKFQLSTPLEQFSEDALSALFYGEDENGKPARASLGLRRNWMGGSVALGAEGDYQSEHFSSALHAQSQVGVSEKRWPGVIPLLESGMQYGDAWREALSRFRQTMDCPDCHGARLNANALSVRVDDLNIAQFCNLSVERALEWLSRRTFTGRHVVIAEPLMKELTHRLSFMRSVGLEYLSLGRSMSTLSGGEAQRIRLASQLGSGLVGVTYVLDEPSIGLHPRDNERLLGTLRSLQERGNTVLVVEHDEATICAADTVIELGPGSGSQGGEIMPLVS